MLNRIAVERALSFGYDETGALDLESVSRAEADALNEIYKMRSPIELPLASGRLRIQIQWMTEHAVNIEDPWTITLAINGQTAEFIVPRYLLELIFAEFDESLSLSTLSPELRNLLLEYALTSAFTLLENSVNCTLAIASIVPGHCRTTTDHQLPVPLLVSLYDLPPCHCLVYISPDNPGQLSDALALIGHEQRRYCQLPFPLHVRWGKVELTLAEIRSLAPGDIILVDNSCRQPGLAVAVIGEQLVAPVDVLLTGYRLSHNPVKAAGSPFEWSVVNKPYRSVPAVDVTTNQVPLSLFVEFGSLMLDRHMIQSLALSEILALARPLEEGLEITLEGTRIGLGELTTIGNATGIRVKRLSNAL